MEQQSYSVQCYAANLQQKNLKARRLFNRKYQHPSPGMILRLYLPVCGSSWPAISQQNICGCIKEVRRCRDEPRESRLKIYISGWVSGCGGGGQLGQLLKQDTPEREREVSAATTIISVGDETLLDFTKNLLLNPITTFTISTCSIIISFTIFQYGQIAFKVETILSSYKKRSHYNVDMNFIICLLIID